MKRAIVELTKKNTELMNQYNDLLSKTHETISEHEKCKNVSEKADSQVIVHFLI